MNETQSATEQKRDENENGATERIFDFTPDLNISLVKNTDTEEPRPVVPNEGKPGSSKDPKIASSFHAEPAAIPTPEQIARDKDRSLHAFLREPTEHEDLETGFRPMPAAIRQKELEAEKSSSTPNKTASAEKTDLDPQKKKEIENSLQSEFPTTVPLTTDVLGNVIRPKDGPQAVPFVTAKSTTELKSKTEQKQVPPQPTQPPKQSSTLQPTEPISPEPTKTVQTTQKAIRTFEGDVAEALARRKISTASMVIQEKERRDRAEREKAEKERLIREKTEKERQIQLQKQKEQREKLEKERLIQEKREQERQKIEKERNEKDRKTREERKLREIVEKQKKEQDKMVREQEQRDREEQARLRREAEEKDRARLEANRVAELARIQAFPNVTPIGPSNPVGPANIGLAGQNPALGTQKPPVMPIAKPVKAAEVMSDEGRAAVKVEPPKPPSHVIRNLFIVFLCVLFIAGGAWGAYSLYKMSALAPLSSTTKPAQTATVKSLIPVDTQSLLAMNPNSPGNVLSKIQADMTKPGDPGTVHSIVPTDAQTGSRLSASQMIGALRIPVPDIIVRTLSGDWVMGSYMDQHAQNGAFVILTHNFFQNAFAGMLSWENRMPSDIAPIIGLSTSPQGHFVDGIVKNHDVREFELTNGNILFLYSFIDSDKLVFANNESTLAEIISRLEQAHYIR